jgi:uncharacterized coiled-coil protein SlyX
MEISTISALVAGGAALVAVGGFLFLHLVPGPNKLRQDSSDRVGELERRLANLELKVASEHPVFLERLHQLNVALAANTTAVERLGTEFHAFIRTFRGSPG